MFSIKPYNTAYTQAFADEERFIVVDANNMDHDGVHYPKDLAEKRVEELNGDTTRFHLAKMDKSILIDMYLQMKGKYEVQKLESTWLDQLADALRDGEEGPEHPTQEIEDVKKHYNKSIKDTAYRL